MKIASFNVENLFRRARALNQDTWDDGKPILEAYAELNVLFENAAYSPVQKQRMVALMAFLGIDKKDDGGNWVILRQNRGDLVKRTPGQPPEIVATGRADWIGWLELKRDAVNDTATRNVARVIQDIGADVVGLVEAEDRPALLRFNEAVLEANTGLSYDHIMLIDGNDERGIDVALMTNAAHPIVGIRSHVDDVDATGLVFSRDCAEYMVAAPSGAQVLVMANHLKSKGFGSQASSNQKRLRQAQRVADLYNERRAEGIDNVVILGDFNDTPTSAPLAPLLANTDLRDVFTSPNFAADGHPGTFANGTASQKIDYILLSPSLFANLQAAGVFRKGVWGNKDGKRWPIFDTMTRKIHAASDHAAVWADIAV